jgi:hypothetical protein
MCGSSGETEGDLKGRFFAVEIKAGKGQMLSK